MHLNGEATGFIHFQLFQLHKNCYVSVVIFSDFKGRNRTDTQIKYKVEVEHAAFAFKTLNQLLSNLGKREVPKQIKTYVYQKGTSDDKQIRGLDSTRFNSADEFKTVYEISSEQNYKSRACLMTGQISVHMHAFVDGLCKCCLCSDRRSRFSQLDGQLIPQQNWQLLGFMSG